MTFHIKLMTYSLHRAGGDKLSASIRQHLIKRIDLEKITAASGSSTLRRTVNKVERRKKFHWHLVSKWKKIEENQYPDPNRGHCRVCEISNNNHLYKAPRGSRWYYLSRNNILQTLGYGWCLLVLRSVCRTNGVCGSILEKMKWHHLMFVLS